MKCVFCGNELKEGCIYCSYCGKEAQIVPDYNALDDQIYMNDMVAKADKNSESDKEKEKSQRIKEQKAIIRRKEKRKKTIIISSVACVVALILIVVLLCFLINNGHKNSFNYQVKKAEAAYEAGDTDKAILYYENAIAIDEENTKIRKILANIYYELKEYDMALSIFDEVINIDDTDREAFQKMIEIYALKDDYSSIVELSKKASTKKILDLFADYLVSSPSFSEEGGSYDEYLEISLMADDDCQIYYTVDGSEPGSSGILYTEPIELDQEGSFEIKAVAVKDENISSEVASEEYVISISKPQMAKVNPDGGSFISESTVSITFQEGCTAYYTWDSTDPNAYSDKYTGPVEIPEGNNMLSVIVIDDKTGKCSDIYRGWFEYYTED